VTDLPPMRERLTRENLHGVWAAIATPFDENDRFDAGVFREDLRRLHATGVHGVYTTDSDGEFYAIEFDEFKQITDVFADEAQRLGLPTQMGVTWSNTRGMVDRLKYAASKGILGAHVGNPYFMPMTSESYQAFWQDLQKAVPEWFALVHYNIPQFHHYLYGKDYAVLEESVPNLVGTKHVGVSFPDFLTLMHYSKKLSHFAGEHVLMPYAMYGARGTYSWFANFNPRYVLDWYDDLVNQRWEAAMQRQKRIHAFQMAKEIFTGSGNLGGIVGKAVSAASPFLVTANRTRRPYLPVSDELISKFKRVVEEQFPDLIWRG
jgi:dihydrodipicolinate synthase/N-acetylneuraminate lyase